MIVDIERLQGFQPWTEVCMILSSVVQLRPAIYFVIQCGKPEQGRWDDFQILCACFGTSLFHLSYYCKSIDLIFSHSKISVDLVQVVEGGLYS